MLPRFACALALLFLSFSFEASAQLKGDPWIFQAYKELYKREPTAFELNISLYNNGAWNNYGELKQYIQSYQSSMLTNNLTFTISGTLSGTNNVGLLVNQDGKTIGAAVVSQEGGTLVAAGGGNLVAAGGGNMVAAGGGNLKDVPGFSLGANRTLLSGEKKVIKTSGKGAIIFRR